jgi:hypothetical protein
MTGIVNVRHSVIFARSRVGKYLVVRWKGWREGDVWQILKHYDERFEDAVWRCGWLFFSQRTTFFDRFCRTASISSQRCLEV